MKLCGNCGETKPFTEFSKRTRKTMVSYQSQCKSCNSQYRRDNREHGNAYRRGYVARLSEKHKLQKRYSHVLRTYNLSKEAYDAMLQEQNGLCKICCTAPAVVVDHCHRTGTVRGLLCTPCNSGLGMFRDDYQIVHKAAEYLQPSEE
jgi:hypothetical protein